MRKIIVSVFMCLAFLLCCVSCSPATEIPDTGDGGKPDDTPEVPEIERAGSIVVVGDSLMDFWDNGEAFLEKYYLEAENKAILATHIYDWYADDRNYPKILESNPDEVLIGVGINDLKAFVNVKDATSYLDSLFKKLLADKPDLYIHCITVNKSYAADAVKDRIEEFNATMKELYADSESVGFIDTQDAFLTEEGDYDYDCFIEDKLHFSEQGYARLEGIFDEYFAPKFTKK